MRGLLNGDSIVSGADLSTDAGRPHFTRRQHEILFLTSRGLTDKEIASTLGISRSTVTTQFDRLFRKNGFHTRAAAVAAWQLEQIELTSPGVGEKTLRMSRQAAPPHGMR
jgi:DNA-binding CsgD family transcriptional regulator